MSGIDDSFKEQLNAHLVEQVAQVEELADQASEVSEYTVLLIANGRSFNETIGELKTIFDTDAVVEIAKTAYDAVEKHLNPQAYEESKGNSDAQISQDANIEDHIIPEKHEDISGPSIPTRPAGLSSRIGGSRNGVTKSQTGRYARPNFALKNADNLQRAMELSGIPSGGRVNRKGRCHKFPHCPFQKDCKYAHPTKPCFQYPNCPNPPGTCNYLHPGEDDLLIAELEKTKNNFIQQKQQNQFIQSQTGISLCKFGNMCTNLQCPFGHPTPANEDAKVIQLEWCPQNLKCEDSQCQKAHSSLSKIKEVKPQQAEKSLEACKFGKNCTNRYCKFRHARSLVVCRDGENCTRIDCFFSHPINEDCRFDTSCKNPNCLFKHPNGKSEAPVTASSLTWTKTDERQFAVPDTEVLEQAPPQEG